MGQIRGSCALFSLLNLLLSLLLPLPLAFLSVSLHDLFVVVGKHGVILICQWDEDVTGGEATGNGVLKRDEGRDRTQVCESNGWRVRAHAPSLTRVHGSSAGQDPPSFQQQREEAFLRSACHRWSLLSSDR